MVLCGCCVGRNCLLNVTIDSLRTVLVICERTCIGRSSRLYYRPCKSYYVTEIIHLHNTYISISRPVGLLFETKSVSPM